MLCYVMLLVQQFGYSNTNDYLGVILGSLQILYL